MCVLFGLRFVSHVVDSSCLLVCGMKTTLGWEQLEISDHKLKLFQWHHVAVVCQQRVVSVYVDGSLVSEVWILSKTLLSFFPSHSM